MRRLERILTSPAAMPLLALATLITPNLAVFAAAETLLVLSLALQVARWRRRRAARRAQRRFLDDCGSTRGRP